MCIRDRVGGTPLHELTRLTEAVRAFAEPGKGARIFVKDEAANASGSFKAPRGSDRPDGGEKRGHEGLGRGNRGHNRRLLIPIAPCHSGTA